ncbi:MAG: HAD family hydrolase [Geminicoccaceae bacterium]
MGHRAKSAAGAEAITPKLTAYKNEAERRGLRDFTVLTLDCYGTLVDRDRGIVNALMPWLSDAGVMAGRGEIIRAFSQAERTTLVTAPGVCYRDILLEIHDALAKFFDVARDHEAAKSLASSISQWPIHADVADALAYLKQYYRLVVLTNIDHASFDGTNKSLGVAFDAVYTAEDIGSYKPSMKSFDFLLNRLKTAGITKERVLHVAGSLRFDHVPAKRRGMSTCWIQRPNGRPRMKDSSTRGIDVHPDFHFESLGAFAEAHRAVCAAA